METNIVRNVTTTVNHTLGATLVPRAFPLEIRE